MSGQTSWLSLLQIQWDCHKRIRWKMTEEALQSGLLPSLDTCACSSMHTYRNILGIPSKVVVLWRSRMLTPVVEKHSLIDTASVTWWDIPITNSKSYLSSHMAFPCQNLGNLPGVFLVRLCIIRQWNLWIWVKRSDPVTQWFCQCSPLPLYSNRKTVLQHLGHPTSCTSVNMAAGFLRVKSTWED